jgi:hypothetical protein
VEQFNGHENMARLEPPNIGPLPRGQIISLSGREILDQLLKRGAADGAFRSDPANELG